MRRREAESVRDRLRALPTPQSLPDEAQVDEARAAISAAILILGEDAAGGLLLDALNHLAGSEE